MQMFKRRKRGVGKSRPDTLQEVDGHVVFEPKQEFIDKVIESRLRGYYGKPELHPDNFKDERYKNGQ